MLSFFRKIRFKSLSDGSLGKYFRYAIGEIILVVLGILIALQINNANNLRIENAELNDYLKKISENVKDDLEQIETLLEKRNTIRELAVKSNHLMRNNDFTDIETIIKGQKVFYEFYFISNTSGFEALKSSSFLGKINNSKLDDLIMNYYARVEKINKAEQSYNNFIENMEAHLSTSINPTPLTIVIRKFFMDKDKDFNINEYTDILPYISSNAYKSAVYRTVAERSYLNHYPKLIELGKQLVAEIEHLNKHN